MADQNNTTQSGTGTAGAVNFDADPKLKADTGAAATAEIAFDSADGVAEADTQPGGSTVETAKQQIKDGASKLGTQAAEQARAFAGQGKERATTALDDVARMFQNAADDVDAKIGAEYGKYARSAADTISGFAESLRGKEVEELVDQAGELVRKSPAIAVGTAAALGFVLARLIKSGVDAASDLTDTNSATDTNSTTATTTDQTAAV
ncbi:hypothetical protein [Sphingomonas xinjiangensis]|uniref:ElaB/YqjD/DUF883 family membrane-anchored ribosome-binding protein n=1 Tax=Sphingomonas xinjiangensis TaxID=643568 RepID=A0A840Y8A7_9SPHN|nr:hypothetical protein [Sphingomonas xinjiangensis]MBB5709094.1 ElaB/YqjD/DUF883 family membrane-anchored ribosome-binding protein [Sphingomonas xinjiangensis]